MRRHGELCIIPWGWQWLQQRGPLPGPFHSGRHCRCCPPDVGVEGRPSSSVCGEGGNIGAELKERKGVLKGNVFLEVNTSANSKGESPEAAEFLGSGRCKEVAQGEDVRPTEGGHSVSPSPNCAG
jgi:hypothetical protein